MAKNHVRIEHCDTLSEMYKKSFTRSLRLKSFDEFLFYALKFVFEHADFDVSELQIDEYHCFVDEFKRRQEIDEAIGKVMDQYE